MILRLTPKPGVNCPVVESDQTRDGSIWSISFILINDISVIAIYLNRVGSACSRFVTSCQLNTIKKFTWMK